MKTLAIETSCDDTSLAIIEFKNNRFVVLQLISFTQLVHKKYGGVVPELASREHFEEILKIVEEVVRKAEQTKKAEKDAQAKNVGNLSGNDFKKFFDEIDIISYTSSPGLPGALVVGKVVAQTLSKLYNKPLIPVNHIFGHLCSLYIDRNIDEVEFPAVILTISGGHNEIYYVGEDEKTKKAEKVEKAENFKKLVETSIDNLNITNESKLTKIGTTLDDASGECFDKVARMLGGPYPGGPRISKQADLSKNHSLPQFGKNPQKKFTRPLINQDHFDVSFSGVKHQVYRFLNQMEKNGIKMTDEIKADIAWEAQETITDILSIKIINAAKKYKVKTIGVVGGVSANRVLFEKITKNSKDIFGSVVKVMKPVKIGYSTDNGAMIGVAGIIGNKKFEV